MKRFDSVDVEVARSPGKVNIDETTFFFHGPPKIGKSTLTTGYLNTIHLVTSEKELGRLRVDYILINTWAKAVSAVDELIATKNKREYRDKKIIVIDFVDQTYLMCNEATCDKLDIDHASEAGYGKGVDMIDTEFRRWINKLIASRYGIIFLSHTQVREVNTIGGSKTKVISSLPKRARDIILPLVNVIGYIGFETEKIKDKKTGEISFIEKRIIDFEPSDVVEAGDREGYLPYRIPLYKNPRKTYELMRDYYTGKLVAEKDDD